MTRINQETGQLEFDGFVRCDQSMDDDFIVGEWYQTSNEIGIQDETGYNYGQFSNVYFELMKTERLPLVVINKYMKIYRFDSFLPTSVYNKQILGISEKEEVVQSAELTMATKTFYQTVTMLSALHYSNLLMKEEQLVDATDWVIQAVTNEIIKLMGYPKSDFTTTTVTDAIRNYGSFNKDIRQIIEGTI
jgi:hypothetical protein